jgi:UDP-N-acetyl-D-glucosamine dehydrogenase
MTVVCVVGLGYVGLPLAVGLDRAGHRVVGYDIIPMVAESLASGTSHIQDVTDQQVAEYNARGNTWTAAVGDLTAADTYIVCVPTPLGADGHPDLSHIESAGQLIGSVLRSGDLVVLESSTYPGTTEEVLGALLTRGSGLTPGVGYQLAYSPERIDPGNPAFRLENTPKIVGGLTDACTDRAVDLYASMGIDVVRAKGLREAELAKLIENTYRHVNIALMNEMVKFCGPLGIDLYDAIRCASSKPFGFEAFYPGPGVGGHCIPIDPHYLSFQVRAKLGHPFRFVELAQEINASMPVHVVDRAQAELNEQGKAMKGRRALLLGVTYKRDVADLRETPASAVVKVLRDRGMEVDFVDPHVPKWRASGIPVPKRELAQCSGYDLVVLLQDHSAFEPEQILAAGELILDTRAVLSGPHVKYL